MSTGNCCVCIYKGVYRAGWTTFFRELITFIVLIMLFILNIIITVATHVLLPSTCLLTAAVHIVTPGYGYIVFPFWGGGGSSIKFIVAGSKRDG